MTNPGISWELPNVSRQAPLSVETMRQVNSLNHTRRECKYHIVFIPKYRRKAIYGQIRQELGEVFRKLAEQKECRIEEDHIMPDHVHMMFSIPPKYAVSQVVGFIKGKIDEHIEVSSYRRRLVDLLGTRGFIFFSAVQLSGNILHISPSFGRSCG